MKSVRLFYPVFLMFVLLLSSNLGLAQIDWVDYSYSTGNNVKCIASQGSTLWLGTAGGGLFKFNKANGQSVQFTKSNSDLPDMTVNDVRTDGTSSIWVATNNGLAFYNGTTWRIFRTTYSGLPSNMVSSVDIDGLGDKWFTTLNGVAKLSGSTWTVFNTSNSDLPSNNVFVVRVKPTGSKWFGTDVGLVRFDGASWTVYNTGNSDIPFNLVNAIAFDNDLGIYVGTGAGFAFLLGDTWTVYTTSNSTIPDDNITSFAWDTEAKLWLGTNKGITKFFAGNFESYSTANSAISSDIVNSVLVDSDNIKWVGTVDSLNKFQDTVWTKYYINKTKLSLNIINDMKVDNAGYLWFATWNGLTNYNGATWKYFNSTKNINIKNLAFDNNGALWMATDIGIAKLNGNNIDTFYTGNSGVPTNDINFVTFDVFNNLWAGTPQGLVKYNGTTWTVFNTSNSSLPDNDVRYLKFQGNTLFWIATANGLASYNSLDWNVWQTGNSGIIGNDITTIQIDAAGNKWIGTRSGVSMFTDTSFVNYDIDNSGLPSNQIESMVFDRFGSLYIGTFDGGLTRKIDTVWATANVDNSHLPSNFIRNLYCDNGNNIYISTILGALVMNVTSVTPTLYITYVTPSVCGGNSIKVKFNNLYSFNTNNIFTVELSDANGSFANPVVIGTKSSASLNGTDSIICPIPADIQSGNGFRVRVRASNPAVLSADNGFDIIIRELPKPEISGRTLVCFDETTSYSSPYEPNVTYLWQVVNGTFVVDDSTNVVTVHWSNSALSGQLKVFETNELGCLDSAVIDVAIFGHPRMIITGPNNVCTDKEYVYTADTTYNTRFWSAIGGKVITMPAYNKVKVVWTSSSENGRLKLVEITPAGCEDSTFYEVVIQPTPTADIHGNDEVAEGTTHQYTTAQTSSTIAKKWYVINGEIIGANNTDTVTIKWPTGGFGAVLHSQKSTAGCIDSNSYTIRIFEQIDVEGIRNVCENTEELYEANKNLGAYALWSVVGGTIVGSNSNRTCTIKWGEPGTGIIRLIQWIPNTSYRDTIDVNVAVNARPPKPTITENKDTLISSADIGNQWYWNGSMIPGATQKRYFTNQIQGLYTVQTTAAYKCVSLMSEEFDFVSSVDDVNLSGDVNVYPNPSDGIFNLNFVQGSSGKLDYVVCDNRGLKLFGGTYDFSNNKQFDIDLSAYSSGLYHVVIYQGNDIRHVRLILNK